MEIRAQITFEAIVFIPDTEAEKLASPESEAIHKLWHAIKDNDERDVFMQHRTSSIVHEVYSNRDVI